MEWLILFDETYILHYNERHVENIEKEKKEFSNIYQGK